MTARSNSKCKLENENLLLYPKELDIVFLTQKSDFVVQHNKMDSIDKIKFDSLVKNFNNKSKPTQAIAKDLLELLNKYPEDIYVVYATATVAYEMFPNLEEKKNQVYPLYNYLIQRLDNDKHPGMKEISINGRIYPEFWDAYWKISTIYLDFQKNKEAIEQNNRGIIGYITRTNFKPELKKLETMYGYQTEAYFLLKNKEGNKYYYCLTKEINPANTYVEKFKL